MYFELLVCTLKAHSKAPFDRRFLSGTSAKCVPAHGQIELVEFLVDGGATKFHEALWKLCKTCRDDALHSPQEYIIALHMY